MSYKKRSKNGFLIFLACILIASALVGALITKAIGPRNYNVSLTRDGFDPDTIVIAKGDSITWKNVDTRFHWPASNPHPVHDGYPGGGGCIGSRLDSCHGLQKGETYTFTFESIGVWGMHDHLFPGSTMSVKVISRISYVFKKNQENKSELSEKTVLPSQKEFMNLDYSGKRELIIKQSKIDPRLAWDYLKKVATENGEVISPVHEFAHSIGHELYKKYGFRGITFCSSEFAYGCYHGVTEQALLTTGKDSIPSIEKACLKLYPPKGVLPTDPGCIHGMGHGLMTWNNLNVGLSLHDCDVLSRNYRSFCWDGVFMEYSMSDMNTFDSQHPWKFCTVLPHAYQWKCASYIVAMVSKAKPMKPNDLAAVCMEGKDKNLVEVCNRRIGFKLTEDLRGNATQVINNCRKITSIEIQASCLKGALDEVAFQKYPEWKNTVTSLCNALPLDYKTSCVKDN